MDGYYGSSRRSEILVAALGVFSAVLSMRMLEPWIAHSGVRTLSDFPEIAVPAEAVLEAGGAGDAIFRQCFTPVVPFLNQRIANREAIAADRGTAIGSDADLRKARDLAGKLFGLLADGAVRHDVFAEADPQALVGRNFAPGQMISSARPSPTIRGSRTVPPSISGTPQRRQ